MSVLPKNILGTIIAMGGGENKQLVVGCCGTVSPSRRPAC
jgi:hypothetical protein